MAHKIEIQLGSFPDDDHHRVRNFVEDVWLQVSKRGWADMENFDLRVNPGAKFEFSVPAQASHEAMTLVSTLVRSHFMQDVATVTHSTRVKENG